MPSAPSSRPPRRTVSMCDPVTIDLPCSVPATRPQMLPTPSRRVSSPTFFIQRSTSSPARAQAVPYSGRYVPPSGCAPMVYSSSSRRSSSAPSMRMIRSHKAPPAGRTRDFAVGVDGRAPDEGAHDFPAERAAEVGADTGARLEVTRLEGPFLCWIDEHEVGIRADDNGALARV